MPNYGPANRLFRNRIFAILRTPVGAPVDGAYPRSTPAAVALGVWGRIVTTPAADRTVDAKPLAYSEPLFYFPPGTDVLRGDMIWPILEHPRTFTVLDVLDVGAAGWTDNQTPRAVWGVSAFIRCRVRSSQNTSLSAPFPIADDPVVP